MGTASLDGVGKDHFVCLFTSISEKDQKNIYSRTHKWLLQKKLKRTVVCPPVLLTEHTML